MVEKVKGSDYLLRMGTNKKIVMEARIQLSNTYITQSRSKCASYTICIYIYIYTYIIDKRSRQKEVEPKESEGAIKYLLLTGSFRHDESVCTNVYFQYSGTFL